MSSHQQVYERQMSGQQITQHQGKSQGWNPGYKKIKRRDGPNQILSRTHTRHPPTTTLKERTTIVHTISGITPNCVCVDDL